LVPCHFFCFVESNDMKCIHVFSKLGLSFKNNAI
jgi:hypothetical protein